VSVIMTYNVNSYVAAD